MLGLTRRQREVFGDKLLDLANIAAATLVFGQFVTEHTVSWEVIGSGLATWSVFALGAFWLTGDK